MLLRSSTIALLVALIATPCTSAAPSREADEFYSRGVRAYFAGNNQDAELYLSLAAELRPDDPRIYYFRALALVRQGRTEEARGDIMVGGALEAAHPQRYPVGSALQRVQGGERLTFERVRTDARRSPLEIAAPVRQASHELVAFDDRAYLRRPVEISLAEFLPGGNVEVEPSYPVEPPSRQPEVQPEIRRAAVAPPAAREESASAELEDPFGDDPVVEVAEEAPSRDATTGPHAGEAEGLDFESAFEESEPAEAEASASDAAPDDEIEDDPFDF